MESLLALAVFNGLARRDFGIGFLGTLLGNAGGLDLVSDHSAGNMAYINLVGDDWCRQLLPSVGYAMGFGGKAFNISNPDQAIGTKLTMQAHAQGWAYNASGSAAKIPSLHFSFTPLLLQVFGYILLRTGKPQVGAFGLGYEIESIRGIRQRWDRHTLC